MTQKSTREFGKEKEEQACTYLLQRGLTVEEKNYQCKTGEIDLIMRDKEYWVFTEVRYRNRKDYGGGLASVDKWKQKKLIKTATFFLQKHKLYDKVPCRFDVVAISGTGTDTKFEWIKDAFWVKY